jgi:hypothetical protein
MLGEAFVFINYKQAAHFGHIGWGFKLDETDRYLFGSTDHLIHHNLFDVVSWIKYMKVETGGDTDFWLHEGTRDEMLHMMKAGHHIRYHHYKSIPVVNPNIEAAASAATRSGLCGWAVFTNNCVHQTFSVLEAYGAELPPPPPIIKGYGLIPRVWFQHIEGELGEIRPPSTPGL